MVQEVLNTVLGAETPARHMLQGLVALGFQL